MFQMMNEARIEVGMGATAMATAAYYASLDYAKERKQGRRVSEKDPTQPQIPIIEHADVKRMLLFQRAVVEGSLSLVMQCSKYVDLQKICTPAEQEKYQLLLEVLTPAAKTYPSEMGIFSISQGLQCFGGSGYCDDYPLEQYYRDARIHPIHEGTTGIHGLDLLGRKVTMLKGKAFEFYLEEVRSTIEEAKKHSTLAPYGQQLSAALEKLAGVTSYLLGIAKVKGPDFFLADATLYLEFFGIISIAWQWLLQAIAIQKAPEKETSEAENNFYQGKFYAFRYFFSYELPKIEGLCGRLMNSDGLTVEMKDEWFSD
jgi:butyryl-CoA dehydrogenase